VRDRYGAAVSGVIRLGTNLPTNAALSTVYQYVVFAKGNTVPRPDAFASSFDYQAFGALVLQFACLLGFFGLTSWHLLITVNLKLDRIEDFLLSLPLAGDNQTVRRSARGRFLSPGNRAASQV